MAVRIASAAKAVTSRSSTPPRKKGVGFWFVLGINIFADLIVLFALLVELVGLATVVGVAISIVFAGIMSIFYLTISVINYSYAFFTGRRHARALVSTGVAFAAKQVPVLNVIPVYTCSFILAEYMENKGITGMIPDGKIFAS